MGHHRWALSSARKALRVASDIDFRRNIALAHEFLGDCYHDQHDLDRALDHYKKALTIGLETAPEGDVVGEAYRRLAEVHYARGEFDLCKSALVEGFRLCDHLHDDFERVGLLRVKAGLCLEDDDLESSDEHYRQAVELCTKRGFRYEQALTLEYQGFAHLTTGRPDTADRFIGEARAIYRELRLTRLALRLERGARAMSRKRPERLLTARVARSARRWESFGIFTRSPELLSVLEKARRVADTHLPVLVIGESGVGKELVASAIHKLSGRPGKLIDINCPAIPETMLESELFGSRRGAFTGSEDRQGLVALADKGSLFLDEIGDMPVALQVKLLRFLETSSYRRVGGRDTHSVDVRLISATNSDLMQKVEAGRFRRDLFHRIAGAVIKIPPLRDRMEDIDFLSEHFLGQLYRESVGAPPSFDRNVVALLRAYSWPGNVRELKHAIESAAFNLGKRKRITEDVLPDQMRGVGGSGNPRKVTVDAVRQELAYHNGSVAHAARALGVSRQTLYRYIQNLGIDLSEMRGR